MKKMISVVAVVITGALLASCGISFQAPTVKPLLDNLSISPKVLKSPGKSRRLFYTHVNGSWNLIPA